MARRSSQVPDGEDCGTECTTRNVADGEDCGVRCKMVNVADGQSCHEECSGDYCRDVCETSYKQVEECDTVCATRYKEVGPALVLSSLSSNPSVLRRGPGVSANLSPKGAPEPN